MLWGGGELTRDHPSTVVNHRRRELQQQMTTVTPSDWARGTRFLLIWCLPITLLLLSAWIGGRFPIIVWPALLTWMATACLLNARRCRRLHCYLTGPFFLLLAVISLLYGAGVLPLGERGWSMLSIVLVVGSLFLVYVPERLFGRYLDSNKR